MSIWDNNPVLIITNTAINLVKTIAILFLFLTVIIFHGRILILEHKLKQEQTLRERIAVLEEKVSWTEDEILNIRDQHLKKEK